MSEPYWVALGSKIPIDYIGSWSAAITYKAGDVVTYNGVDYIAVNPSTGSTPPTVTGPNPPAVGVGISLPVSPSDGQEYILVDSLTVPTYSWRLRYIAGISDAYKWLFVGGIGLINQVADAAADGCTATTFVDLAQYGPSLTVVRAGVYEMEFGFSNNMADAGGGGNRVHMMGISINAAAISVIDMVTGAPTNAGWNQSGGFSRATRKTFAAATSLVAKYRVPDQGGGAGYFQARWLKLTPVRIS